MMSVPCEAVNKRNDKKIHNEKVIRIWQSMRHESNFNWNISRLENDGICKCWSNSNWINNMTYLICGAHNLMRSSTVDEMLKEVRENRSESILFFASHYTSAVRKLWNYFDAMKNNIFKFGLFAPHTAWQGRFGSAIISFINICAIIIFFCFSHICEQMKWKHSLH